MSDAKSGGGREREHRIEKLEKIRELGIDPYPYRFQRTHSIAGTIENREQLIAGEVRLAVAGRIMSVRGHGHTAFGHIKDDTGTIQFYIRDDQLDEHEFGLFKLLDVGDIVGLWGVLFTTRSGELTVRVANLELLAKSIRPLPEKFHGLQDKELRYRHRYVDLIVNDEVMKVFRMRSKILETMRQFLLGNNFLEVETPILQPLYGGAMARPFVTRHNALDMDLYLRIADELYLKRLIVGGMERVFEFSKDFRNEGMDRSHNPEFTMLECYAAYWDYNDMMGFVEEMFSTLATEVCGTTDIQFGEHSIDLSPPWRRLTFFEALHEVAGEDLRASGEGRLEEIARSREIDLEGISGRTALLDTIFSELVEPALIQPTFITDYPLELSPLAKIHRADRGLVERFEPYIAGFEVGNAFSELNDPLDQRARFEAQAELRKAGLQDAHPVDDDYIRALEYGMPPTGGIGIGVDRVVMLLTGATSIRDVILFPQMRPEEGRDGA
ncbi:MAG: lysine--tRNA ligase [bacterium]|nr:MAG: lysine--tRNA ligase [bacterium]